MTRKRIPVVELPFEIILDIILRLPVISLLKMRLVCKQWQSLISDPEFIKTHLNRINKSCNTRFRKNLFIRDNGHVCSFDYQTCDHIQLNPPFANSNLNTEVLASCDGVLLVNVGRLSYLWNPSTRVYIGVHFLPYYPERNRTYGLYYDSSIDAFKILFIRVRLEEVALNRYVSNAFVYNSKSNSAKKIEDFQYRIVRNEQGAKVNGAPHWLVKSKDGINQVIIYFDPIQEKFEEVSIPGGIYQNVELHLGVFEGLLCLVHNQGWKSEVLVMKEYGVKESWTRLFIVERPPTMKRLKPVCFTENGEVVLERDNGMVVIHNLEDKTFRNILSFSTQYAFKTLTYTESLVSPFPGNERAQGQ